MSGHKDPQCQTRLIHSGAVEWSSITVRLSTYCRHAFWRNTGWWNVVALAPQIQSATQQEGILIPKAQRTTIGVSNLDTTGCLQHIKRKSQNGWWSGSFLASATNLCNLRQQQLVWNQCVLCNTGDGAIYNQSKWSPFGNKKSKTQCLFPRKQGKTHATTADET